MMVQDRHRMSIAGKKPFREDTGDKDDEDEDDDEDTGKKPTRQVLLNKIRKKKEVINKLRKRRLEPPCIPMRSV